MRLQIIIKFLLFVLFAFLLFLIFSIFHRFLSFPNAENTFTEEGEVKLYPNHPISQIFVAKQNGLNQLDIAIRDFNEWSKNKISFELKDSNCDQTIASNTIDIFSPDYTIYTPFRFPRIPDSQEKTYCAEVTFVTDKENFDEASLPFIVYSRLKGNFFTNSGENNEDNPGSAKLYNGKTLVMKPAYGSGIFSQDISILNDRISQYKPWFLKYHYLYAISILFVIFSVVLVAILIIV
jgi:hypothetical protein